MARRHFGAVRRRSSGRWQASYWHEGQLHLAPQTFSTKSGALAYLSIVEADIHRGAWIDPQSGRVTLAAYGKGETGVAEIVKVEVRPPDRDAGPVPRLLEPAGGEGHAGGPGEHERLGLGRGEAQEMVGKGGEDVRGDGDRAPTGRALRLLHERAAVPREGATLLDRQGGPEDVDVLAAQTEQLAPAELAPCGGQDGDAEAIGQSCRRGRRPRRPWRPGARAPARCRRP